MVKLSAMKEYFHILLNEDKDTPSEHPFAEDARRFFLFKRIRDDFHKMHLQMENVSHLLEKSCPDYARLMTTLNGHFMALSQVSDADFDYYMRTLAVEKCIHQKSSGQANVPDMLNNLLQGMVQLFVSDGDKIHTLVEDALKNLHEKHQKKSFFEAKSTKLLREAITQTADIYEQIEHDLTLAKEGIVAKDKRMLELLQKLKIGIGDSILEAAIENTNVKMPTKNVVSFTEAIKKKAANKQRKMEAQVQGAETARGL